MQVNRESIAGRSVDSRLKADLKPSAPYSILVQPGSKSGTALDVAVANFMARSKEPPLIKAVVSLQHQEGLRISEVISIKPSDVKSGLRIVIQGKKRSENRIITPIYYRDFWERYAQQFTIIGDIYSRHYFKRLYVKYGLYLDMGKGKPRAVTHSMRHNYIDSLAKQSVETSDIKKHIGHKSSKSTESYINHEQEKESNRAGDSGIHKARTPRSNKH